MADGKETQEDPTANFVVHDTTAQPPATSESSMQDEPAPEPEPEPETDDEEIVDDDDADDGSDGAGAEDAEDDDADDEDGSDEGGDDDEERPKKRKTAKARIAELTKARREAERKEAAQAEENAELRARLDALEKKLTGDDDDGNTDGKGDSNADDDEGRPDPNKFKYGELDPEFQEALLDWKVDKRLNKEKAEREKAQKSEAAEQQAQEIRESYDQKIDIGIAEYDDFEDVVVKAADEGKFPLTQETAMMVLESDVGHHVIYQIASDNDLAKKLAGMTPQQQAREFGRLEAQYTSKDAPKPKKKASAAPVPPSRAVKGGGAPKKFDPSSASFEELEKWWAGKQKK